MCAISLATRDARRVARGIERVWLDQMEEYMGAATSKRAVTDSLAYCVVISNGSFGDFSFRDYVQNQRVSVHPVAGNGWPTVPPNFRAFRWNNAVRQINHVTDYAIAVRLGDRFAAVEHDESASSRPPWGVHFVYQPRSRPPASQRRHPERPRRAEPAGTTLLMRDDLSKLPKTIYMARRSHRVVKANLVTAERP